MNNHVPKGAKLNLSQGATMFSGEKKFFLFEDMIIPWGKKVYVVPYGNLSLLFPNIIVLEKTYVSNLLTIIVIS